MSYLLEILGRGLVSSLRAALRDKLPSTDALSPEVLRQHLAQEPHDQEKTLLLGLQYLWEEQFLKAGRQFQLVLDADDESVSALLGMASVHDELGRAPQALELLNRARVIDVMDPAILFGIGFCHEKLNQCDEAVHAYQASLRACPDLRNSHERLAAIYLRSGKYHEAITHYEQLVELDPERMSDRLALANLYLKVQDSQAAITQYETAIALDPDNWELHEDLVSAYGQAGLVREAIELLHDMIDHQPQCADHHLRLGDLYSEAGDDVAALQQYQQALNVHPEYLEAIVKVGAVYLRAGQHTDAARYFSRAVELNDRLLSACVGLGVAQMQAGREEEGRSSFDLAARIEPNSTLLFSESARMQLKAAIGDQISKYFDAHSGEKRDRRAEMAGLLLERQIDLHRAAVKEKPNHADLHYRLGLLLKNRGHLEEAVEAFTGAVHINPAYEKALVKLGLTLRELGRTDDALAMFKRALEISPTDAQLHYQLGVIFAEKHMFELAVDHLEAAQKGLPDGHDIQANLALALQNVGLLDRAEVSWQTTANMGKDIESADVNLN